MTLHKQLEHFRAKNSLGEITVGKHRWTYFSAGDSSNEALLLLHGGGGDAEAMFRYIEGFSRHFRVIAPNVPHSISKVEDAVTGLQAILAQENITQAHIVGFSFGALLAQIYIRRFPDSVLDMVITHAVIPSDHLAEPIDMQRALMRLYPNPLLMWLTRRSYRSQLNHSSTPSTTDERAFWQGYFDKLYATRFSKKHLLSRARISSDYHHSAKFKTSDLRAWVGELLIIESSHDDVIGEGDRGALIGMYPQVYVQTLWGYDHLAPLLAADELLSSITKFLQNRDE